MEDDTGNAKSVVVSVARTRTVFFVVWENAKLSKVNPDTAIDGSVIASGPCDAVCRRTTPLDKSMTNGFSDDPDLLTESEVPEEPTGGEFMVEAPRKTHSIFCLKNCCCSASLTRDLVFAPDSKKLYAMAIVDPINTAIRAE